MTAQYALEFHGTQSPEAIAFADARRSISFAEAEHLVQQLCVVLADRGFPQARRMGILAANSIETVLLSLAIQRLGHSAAMLNTRLLAEDWERQLEASRCSVLFQDQMFQEAAAMLPETSAPRVAIAGLFADAEAVAVDGADLVPPFEAQREAVLIFTSGSSGQHKGVRLSLGNFLASAAGSNEITGLAEGDTWLVGLPMYHLSGLGIVYRTMYAGARSYIADSSSDEELAKCLRQNHITHLSLVPTQLAMLIEQGNIEALSRLKAIVLAGAASSRALLAQIKELRLPVLSAYGMTETTAHCCCMRLDDPIVRVTGVGRPFSSTEIEVVDEQRQPVPQANVGEVRFRGPTVCLGYTGDLAAPIDDAGWLYSGDLGVLDEDGNLTLVGRKDDMFISGGENIHPLEIEHAALAHPAVQRAAVVAVDDEKWGKRPVLFYEQGAGQVSCDELAEFLQGKLARIKIPHTIIPIEEMPLTSIGKNDYPKLLTLLEF